MDKEPGVVAHAFNPSTREAETGGFLSSRPAWSTELVPGQPGLYKKTKTKQNKTKTDKQTKNVVYIYLIGLCEFNDSTNVNSFLILLGKVG